MMKRSARYGVDAPGVVRAHFVVGFPLALIAAISLAWPRPNPVPLSLSIGAASVAALLLVYGAVMVWSSLVGKKRVATAWSPRLNFRGTSACSTPDAAVGWR